MLGRLLFLFTTMYLFNAYSEAQDTLNLKQKNHSEIVSHVSLQVENKDSVRANLIQFAEARQGYFHSYDENSLVLKVPQKEYEGMVGKVLGEGEVLYKNYQIIDLEANFTELEARLKAKQKLLLEYEKILSEARQQAMVQVERALNKIVEEIESTKGQLNQISARTQWTTLHIYFQFPYRPPPLPTGNTPFTWVNALGIQNLQDGFVNEK